MKLVLLVIFGLLVIRALMTIGDFGYGKRVDRRYAKWNASISRDADGIRTGCRAYRAGNGQTAILLVHGFADSPAVYHLLTPALVERGFACRVMRLPGFAETRDAYATTNRAKWEDAMRGELEALRPAHEQTWIVAHSTGASVALKLLAAEAKLADGVVLLAPLLRVGDVRSPVLKTSTWFKIGEKVFQKTDMIENVFPLDIHHPTDGYAGKDRFVPLVVYREVFALMSELENAASSISHPAMLVLADSDKVIDSNVAVAFHDAMASNVKRRLILKDTGHLIPLDHTWEQLAEEVDSFVRLAGRRPVGVEKSRGGDR